MASDSTALFLNDVVALGPDPLGPAIDDATAKSQVAARRTAVEKALNGSDVAGALDLSLRDPPYGASEAMRVRART